MKLILAFFLLYFVTGHSQTDDLSLNIESAGSLAEVPLECIGIEYPNKLNQVLTDSSHLQAPSKLHPIFYGCFDWHSAVHGHWLLASLMNKFQDTELEKRIIGLMDAQLSQSNVEAELAYFEPKLNKSFERTYGWAWYLKLHAELFLSSHNVQHQWTRNLQPLTDYVVLAYMEFLPKLVYPIRVGEHSNTAFGLSLALDYANIVGDTTFQNLIIQRAKDFYLADENCPLTWEPSGFDFISPCLQEAELMSKVLNQEAFNKWLSNFLPAIGKKNFELEPGKVLDRTDGKLVHLDGLNFSRAWCLYRIAKVSSKNKDRLVKVADEHIRASMQHVIGSDYMGSHWLATFLVYALEGRKSSYE